MVWTIALIFYSVKNLAGAVECAPKTPLSEQDQKRSSLELVFPRPDQIASDPLQTRIYNLTLDGMPFALVQAFGKKKDSSWLGVYSTRRYPFSSFEVNRVSAIQKR